MFRSKKGASQGSEPAGETTVAAEVVTAQPEVAKPEPRRSIPFPAAARPLPHTAFPLDISRRSSELSQMAGRGGGEAAPAAASKDKVMSVGRDVELRGEVAACDRLIIDGTAQLTMNGARLLQVGGTGLFTGTADVADADVAGRFDGDLTVRERLTIRATGLVRGRIRYGQIVIEAGGELTGDVGMLDGQVRVPLDEEGARDDAPPATAGVAEVKLAAPAD
jgi:cytoskeletal protein CcmA (bactofilin family)